MTAIQIGALISIIFAAAILYWVGYRGGLIDGRIEGIDEGKAIQQSDSSGAIRDLELLLEQAQTHHKQLFAHYRRALDASKLGEPARKTLLDIAEKLRIAAETFSAFRTGKKLERDSLALRDQALAMAALLDPAVPKLEPTPANSSITEPQGRWVIERGPTEAMCPEEARKALLFFRTEAELDTRNQKAVGGDV
ncbi:hypothetical protein [Pseudomonas extremaustralis]|uniref:hypothetical protein n=1 Tax=Pseudomonas extremaustralis TaxID=359110 RepID=UPI002905B6F3|nr:hypothetical protein [Pseudomonas extremaustralis]